MGPDSNIQLHHYWYQAIVVLKMIITLEEALEVMQVLDERYQRRCDRCPKIRRTEIAREVTVVNFTKIARSKLRYLPQTVTYRRDVQASKYLETKQNEFSSAGCWIHIFFGIMTVVDL